MTWKAVRLELARTKEFPNGSAGRAYLLRLPLGEDGVIDDRAYRANPTYATVRRYWPNEPDRAGYLLPQGSGWAFSYAIDLLDRDRANLEAGPIRLGGELTILEADGRQLPFRVVRCDG